MSDILAVHIAKLLSISSGFIVAKLQQSVMVIAL